MNTYIYAQHTVRAGDVVIPQPEGKEQGCMDYEVMTLKQAKSFANMKLKTSNDLFLWKAACNVLAYHGKDMP